MVNCDAQVRTSVEVACHLLRGGGSRHASGLKRNAYDGMVQVFLGSHISVYGGTYANPIIRDLP